MKQRQGEDLQIDSLSTLKPNESGLFDEDDSSSQVSLKDHANYRVLARKYRPLTFSDLIGQESMVRTLRNAFALGRVAHAFMLTGVRGVGKTTTARIIARALNCIGPDGKGGPTPDPCGVCFNCRAILNDRHPDVLEMDAASHTGVDDVREIIETTRFCPVQGRMKVFIIDEVHMLSRSAFNALLKTLEEPPEQATFIFATTELRKVPVTVLSRCQRFDLRRISQTELIDLFRCITEKERVHFSDEALALVARVADGSVRDGLSLLDQAIAHALDYVEAHGIIGQQVINDMLGLADRDVVLDMLELTLTGETAQVLNLMDTAYNRGIDPGLILADMLELVHTISRLRIDFGLVNTAEMSEATRVRGEKIASMMTVPVLMRTWQILLKGVQELEYASDRRAAADMVLIRLCYVADLPSPEEVIRRIVDEKDRSHSDVYNFSDTSVDGNQKQTNHLQLQLVSDKDSDKDQENVSVLLRDHCATDSVKLSAARELTSSCDKIAPRTWREAVALVQNRAPVLHGHLRCAAHEVNFQPGEIIMRVESGVPKNVDRQFRRILEEVTGRQWRVILSNDPGQPTLDIQGTKVIEFRRKELERHPFVQAALSAFPDAEVCKVYDNELDNYGLPQEELSDIDFLSQDEVCDQEGILEVLT
ncbi:MAG: DNA polymerase III subunit gamma/tau [Acetobacter sp.]|nr:DNA polymerase III subunit gamma/tau [Acetobacter sp.]